MGLEFRGEVVGVTARRGRDGRVGRLVIEYHGTGDIVSQLTELIGGADVQFAITELQPALLDFGDERAKRQASG